MTKHNEDIIREVLDTFYEAKGAILGLTALDTELEMQIKIRQNECATTRRIDRAISAIQQLEESNPWHKVSEELPKERHYKEKTLQGIREWDESEPVLVIDAHNQKGVDCLKNGKWMKLRNNPKDCDGFLIEYLYWMEIPEIKEN